MEYANYVIITLILLGAIVMLLSAAYTQKIFTMLPNSKLKANWKKLRILMFVFFGGYVTVVGFVFYGKTDLLALLSGVIFFMGSLFVFLVVLTGLDSFKKLKELNQDLDKTQFKNNELEQFAYITSHDLKTPIRGISTLATFIKQDLDTGKTDKVDDYLSTIQGQVERLENLINGILNYSKVGDVTLETVSLKEMVLEEFKSRMNLGSVVFAIKSELPIVNGDRIQLSQVVSNLIGNAINHNDKKVCEICISSVDKPDYHEIIFNDNGPGIELKYHQKIFEVFQTLKEKNNSESTGIGLSIVKKIIEKHKGTIRVETNKRSGASFIISYPKNLEL